MGKALSEMTLEELWQLFPIILKEHNEDYKSWYLTEKEDILRCLTDTGIKRISHIGSTAVEGLLAKPTVDILLEIGSEYDADTAKEELTANGWILMNDQKQPYLQMDFNKGYTPEGFAEKVYHLHLRKYGDWDELYFCDYLKEHKEAAGEYAQLKKGLLEKFRNNRDGYTEAKSTFIANCTREARVCYGDRYLPR